MAIGQLISFLLDPVTYTVVSEVYFSAKQLSETLGYRL
jgi:hypothetical protein